MIEHPIDWTSPAKLIRGDHVAQFGEGYRQVSGPDIAKVNVHELLAQARTASPAERAKLFIVDAPGFPHSIEEIELALASGGGVVGVGGG